jgi:hypothetical protein
MLPKSGRFDTCTDTPAVPMAARSTAGVQESGAMSAAERWFTRKEAADLCGVSVDTIKRAVTSGRLPNAVRSALPAGVWTIPMGDLVTAGMYDASAADVAPEVAIRSTRAERELDEARLRVGRLEVEVEMLTREMARRDDEARFLRKTLAQAIARGQAA